MEPTKKVHSPNKSFGEPQCTSGFTFEGAEPIEIGERVSYLPNNLSLLVSDTICSYAFSTRVRALATTDAGGGAITDTIFVGMAEESEFAPPLRVMAVRWVAMGGLQCLVVLTLDGVEVYNQFTKRLYKHRAPETPKGTERCCRGIAVVGGKFLCVGTSAGAIMVIEIRGPGKFKHVADLAGGHDAPISDLSSDAADATSGTMLSSDGAGLVILWDIAKLIPLLKEGGEIPMIQLSAPDTNGGCVCMCMSKGMLVAGYSSGLIRFFHLGTRKKVVEIAAHARGINAMTISPDNLLATTSDDGAVQVWSMPDIENHFETRIIFSAALSDKLPTGLAFHPLSGALAVSCYDSRGLIMFARKF